MGGRMDSVRQLRSAPGRASDQATGQTTDQRTGPAVEPARRGRRVGTSTAPDGVRPARALAALVPVALTATVSLWWPEHSDQAAFDVGARGLVSGLRYDRDLWDLKQPGIYWFHALGELVLPGGLGARVLEALLAVVGGLLVLRIAARRGLRPGVVVAAPSIVMVPYLLAAWRDGIGQIESLMVVLQLAVVAGTWPADTAAGRARPRLAWFGAGIAVGLVVLLKTLYLPVPLTLLAGGVLMTRRARRSRTARRGGTARLVAAAAAGAVLPVAAAVGYLAVTGALRIALVTTLELPFRVVAGVDLHPAFAARLLVEGLLDVASLTAPLALVGLLGRFGGRGVRGRPGAGLRDLTLVATVVITLGLGVVQLWTPYRLLLLAAPLGLLALGGAQVLAVRAAAATGPAGPPRATGSAPGRVRRATAAAAVAAAAGVLLLPALQGPGGLLLRGRIPTGLDVGSRAARAAAADGPGSPVATARLVAGRVAPGSSVAVLGDQLVLRLLDARPGTEVFGQSLWLMPDTVQTELARELDRSRPGWLWVDAEEAERLGAQRTPGARALAAVLGRRYRRVVGTGAGSWYAASVPGPGLPADGVHLAA